MVISVLSLLFVVFLVVSRHTGGHEAEGVFTLCAILSFLVGVATMGPGIIGECAGRISREVRHRTRCVIRAVNEDLDA
jgi:undecaprenyl-phosphate 4-deoxy-4-formamido-L-arabinose transferase